MYRTIGNTFFIVSIVIIASCVGKSKPVIRTSLDTIRFNEIQRGSVQEAVVKLYNDGGDTLKLGRLAMTCGCTGGELGKNVVLPGDSTDLSVVYDSNSDPGNSGGIIDKSIIVENNSNEMFKIISITGSILN